MMLVDETLVSDIARKHSKISRMVSKSGLQDHDSDLSDFLKSGIDKQRLFREISKFSEETENDDLI